MKGYFLLVLSIVTMGCQNLNLDKPELAKGFIYIPQMGSSFENGLKHGQELREQIHVHVEAWESAMKADLGLDRDSLSAIIFTHTAFLPSIEEHTPHLLEELKGIAEGSGLSYERLLAYNLGEEIYNYCNQPFESCSNLAKENPQENILAYNQDLPHFLHGDNRPLILVYEDYYVFTLPGHIGISGVSRQLAVSCNSLPMLHMNFEGLALPFKIRKILQASSVDQAKAFMKEIPSAIPQNILMASSEQLMGFEFSGNRVEVYTNSSTQNFLYHTNTALFNTDYKDTTYQTPHCPRYVYLDSLVQESDGKAIYSEATLKELMAESSPRYPVLNEKTFLRYIAVFPKNRQDAPHISLINPKQDNAEIHLNFNLNNDQHG